MEDKPVRRGDRVRVSIPIEVSGIDPSGQDFCEKAYTVIVSKNGASIKLKRRLAPEQELSLHVAREAEIRVLGQIEQEGDATVYAVAFRCPQEDLWGIQFEPSAEGEEANARVLLTCTACHTRAVAYLDYAEAAALEAQGSLHRECRKCSERTVWKRVGRDGMSEAVATVVEPIPPAGEQAASQVDDGMPSQEAPRTRATNRRKHNRTRIKTMVCVRSPRVAEEVVESADTSRGGLSFVSAQTYAIGPVEVALFYKSNAANIFVPARIVYMRELKPDGPYRYGLQYTRR